MKKIVFTLLFLSFFSLINAQTDADNGDWKKRYVFLKNTSEAEYMIRYGDIDNLGFGWEQNFNPFSGKISGSHEWPMERKDSTEIDGFDLVQLGTSFRNPENAKEGYSGALNYLLEKFGRTSFEFAIPLKGIDTSKIKNVSLQIFVDDFQAKAGSGSKFEFYINKKRYAPAEKLLNSLDQTGPIGKLITIPISVERISDFKKDTLQLQIDDRTSGMGDGFAIDFFKILVNTKSLKKGTVAGKVLDANGKPVANASISCNGETVKSLPNGSYKLVNVPSGLAVITVTNVHNNAFYEKTFSFDVESGKDAVVDLQMDF
ncbi:MAG: carboxypeptidase-like regulatory domain-containing protein [Bacteroidota bacterium]|nr:carboxypeptidase-like regulatory domain-containing protein [Bacteroidota bacterium]